MDLETCNLDTAHPAHHAHLTLISALENTKVVSEL